MDKNEELKIIEETQQIVARMKMDDLEEDASLAEQMFDCDCCGKEASLAGSIVYSDYRLCNDCVLLAETGFALGKLKSVDDLIKAMEDKRLEELCDLIKKDKISHNN